MQDQVQDRKYLGQRLVAYVFRALVAALLALGAALFLSLCKISLGVW